MNIFIVIWCLLGINIIIMIVNSYQLYFVHIQTYYLGWLIQQPRELKGPVGDTGHPGETGDRGPTGDAGSLPA
jgi:hypothetical protein